MTDSDIVKALEYCTNCVCNNDKDECPLLKMSFCKNYLMKQSLDLINRQKAEIAELESEIATLKHSNINLQELYYAQKEKVAKSKQKVIDVCRQLQTAKAEIDRLKRKLVGYEPSIDSGLFSQMLLEQKEKAEAFEKKWKAEIKSEAYREFAEKINAEAEKVEIDREGDFVEAENKIYYTVADWCNATSDNLLKELVGEDDG